MLIMTPSPGPRSPLIMGDGATAVDGTTTVDGATAANGAMAADGATVADGGQAVDGAHPTRAGDLPLVGATIPAPGAQARTWATSAMSRTRPPS